MIPAKRLCSRKKAAFCTLTPIATHVAKTEKGNVVDETVDPPERFGRGSSVNQLAGGGPLVNAEILEGILRCEVQGPKRDMAVLNAGAALVVAGLAENLEAGCTQAEEKLDSGAAARALEAWRAFSA